MGNPPISDFIRNCIPRPIDPTHPIMALIERHAPTIFREGVIQIVNNPNEDTIVIIAGNNYKAFNDYYKYSVGKIKKMERYYRYQTGRTKPKSKIYFKNHKRREKMNADSKRLLRDLAVDLLGSSLFRGYKITIGAFAIHASSGWDSAGFTEEDTMESIAQQFAGDGRHTEEIRRLRVAGGIVIADRDTIQGPLLIHPVVITLASFTFMSPEQKREVYAYTRYTHT